MCATIEHRGPDAEGIYTAPGIGLGERRLSIIDLSSAATAPLSNEDGSIWVVFNGEIYNYQEIRRDLESKGHLFRSQGDTEVIVHLYEQEGTSCIEKLRGMFAFAVWDGNQKMLFAARDRLGKKPFCYARSASGFIFGSEIKSITADPSVRIAPDFFALDQYLTYQYVPSPLTAFQGIKKLPPGHWLTCRADGTLHVERYWSPLPGEASAAPPEEIEQELLRLLRESVRLRMVADVPWGAFLSGGIDSSAVVALMAQESAQPVKTFSIGFTEQTHDERPWARLVAERYGTQHHEFLVTPNAAEVLPVLVRHYNEPFADSSALPTYYVSKMTRQHVTVALSGDGGDENFAGYNHYAEQLQWARMEVLPASLRRFAGRSLGGILALLPHQRTVARMSRALHSFGSPLPERYVLQISCLKPQERQAVYTPQFRSLAAQRPADYGGPDHFPPPQSEAAIDWMMRHDLSFYLPDCLMVKTDIASMANSLEVRCPFLDHRLVEFSATIPSWMKSSRKSGKQILKRALRGLLPETILNRKKAGFSVPLAKWFRDGLQPLLSATLLDERCQRRGLLQQSFLRVMVDEHATGKRDWSRRLWALLFLELWFREFID